MAGGQLKGVSGLVAAAPADEAALAVADALLPAPLPRSLRAFLAVCDGARVGDVEVFAAEGIAEATSDGALSWHLGPGTLVVGRAGVGRSLVMPAGRDEVCEVDDDPWDSRTMAITADTPLDLFLRHRGLALRERDPWWALPALAGALDAVGASLARDVGDLLDAGIGTRVGDVLPRRLTGFRPVAASLAGRLLASEEHQMWLVNYRPDAPEPGPCAARQWSRACDAVAERHGRFRDLLRAAPLAEPLAALDRHGGQAPLGDSVRDLAFLALLGKARDDLADLVSGTGPGPEPAPGRRLAHVYLAGHVPVSHTSAI
ncbi:hypothetical protein ACFPM7_20625 [Actinokineospora guangxiensis]|uniref:SMI1/KNR4 family protein n=1 Tax=Actinokineospora guangxiensis TaxID=1490288 RepID=A0ABW0EQ99_9PSEU